MKNVRNAGFSRKRGGNAGSGTPLPDPVKKGLPVNIEKIILKAKR